MLDYFTGVYSRIKSSLFSLNRNELQKLIPMVVMLFLICFCYSILRPMKDAIVVTAKTSGADVIPYIKLWFMLPLAFFSTMLFTWLSTRYSQERAFYIMLSGFLLFYAAFAFVLYPLQESIQLNALANFLEQYLPAGSKGLTSAIRNWSLTLFYVLSELWGSIFLGVLFWGFANEVTRISEAKYFYGILTITSNVAAIFAGQIALKLTRMEYLTYLPFGKNSWEQTVDILVLLVIASGVIVMATFWWVNKKVLVGPEYRALHEARAIRKKKKRLSLKESFAFLSQSKYLLCIAIMVLGYNVTINLVEVVWKDQLRTLYPAAADYNAYMAYTTIGIGVVSTFISLFITKSIGKMGWTFTALLTPFILLFTSVGFFSFLFFQKSLAPIMISLTGYSPLVIAVGFGALQNCLSKGAKYSVFDATKEMAFIPLDHDVKLKGKAAIDGFGSRLGKSGGSLIHQMLLIGFGSLAASAPYVAGILSLIIILWIISVKSLGKQFYHLVESKGELDSLQEEERFSKEKKKKLIYSQ